MREVQGNLGFRFLSVYFMLGMSHMAHLGILMLGMLYIAY
jgi:hypothetical protein